MKVSLVSTAYPPIPGGMEVYVGQIARNLFKVGHEVRVVTRFVKERPSEWRLVYTSSESGRSYKEHGVDIATVSHPWWMKVVLPALYRLQYHQISKHFARRLGVIGYRKRLHDLVQGSDVIHYSGNGQEVLGFASAYMASELEIPFVVTPHTHANAWGDSVDDFELYKLAHQTIALTADERNRLEDGGLRRSRISIIPHASDVSGQASAERFRKKYGINGPVVFFLGRKTSAKGYSLILNSAPLVWECVPDAKFVLAGPADPEEPDRPAVLSDERIFDLGFLSNEDRDDAYAAADIFCLPSAHEAYGIVYNEAWSFGKPVVGLRIPTLVELIEGTGGGLLAEHSPEAVADALCTLLEDSELRRRLGLAGKLHASRRSWKDVVAETLDVYKKASAECFRSQRVVD